MYYPYAEQAVSICDSQAVTQLSLPLPLSRMTANASNTPIWYIWQMDVSLLTTVYCLEENLVMEEERNWVLKK
jgi:hypothetical protein